MRFDLGAVAEVLPKPEHWLSNPRLANPILYGTRLLPSEQLLWFSPDAGQTPTPVPMISGDLGRIETGGLTIEVRRTPEGWQVEAPER